ncbi:MAG: hypothetical protein ACK4F5_14310 [Aliihoeflea sp.]
MKVKVAKNTPDHLFIVLKPYGRFLFVPVAVLFGAVAAIAIWSMGSIYSLSVADGVLHYEQRFLGGRPTYVFSTPVEAVREIDIVVETTLGFISTNQIRVRTDSEDILLRLPSDGQQKRLLADELAPAVATGADAAVSGVVLDHEEDGTGGAYILAGICLIAALRALWALQTISVVGDAKRARLVLTKRRTLSPWGSRTQTSLAEIDGIDVAPFTLTTAKGQTTTSYDVNLRMRSGAAVSIAFGPMFTAESSEETRTLIDGWLSRQPRSGHS